MLTCLWLIYYYYFNKLFGKFSILISNSVNINRHKQHNQKILGSLIILGRIKVTWDQKG